MVELLVVQPGDIMFTRSSPAATKSAPTANGAFSAVSPETNEKSVIGNDLKIIGRGVLQVDGEIEGDVQAAEVIVGEKGQVTGMVAGRQVVVRGKVSGIVCGRTVALQAASNVNGDIHHMSLLIEQGALFEGRSRRAKSEQDLNAVLEGSASQQLTAGEIG
jgi:cytoskeletal protein CcmA (bactofilin family)